MDPFSLAAMATPFVAKGAEAFTKTAGEKLGGKVGELCQAVMNRFKGDSYAEQTLARAQEKPESEERQGALKGVLAEKMKENPDFAERVRMLVQDMQKEVAQTGFDQRGQMVHGPQTNIVGNVQGLIMSATFSGPLSIDEANRREQERNFKESKALLAAHLKKQEKGIAIIEIKNIGQATATNIRISIAVRTKAHESHGESVPIPDVTNIPAGESIPIQIKCSGCKGILVHMRWTDNSGEDNKNDSYILPEPI